MPIFEFTCRRCEHNFETIVLSSRAKITCPKCASKAVDASAAGYACTPQSCGCH